jgi:hypothetical protein
VRVEETDRTGENMTEGEVEGESKEVAMRVTEDREGEETGTDDAGTEDGDKETEKEDGAKGTLDSTEVGVEVTATEDGDTDETGIEVEVVSGVKRETVEDGTVWVQRAATESRVAVDTQGLE